MGRPDDMYPQGYPSAIYEACCNYNGMLGATCIIDNKHEGRSHWGPDKTGRYHQWANSSLRFVSSASSLSAVRTS